MTECKAHGYDDTQRIYGMTARTKIFVDINKIIVTVYRFKIKPIFSEEKYEIFNFFFNFTYFH